MKKMVPIIIIGILLISGIGAIAVNVEKNTNMQSEIITDMFEIDISTLKITDNNDYIEVSFGTEQVFLMNPGQPMIPRMLKTYELPFGITNIKIEAEPSDIQEIEINKEIVPASSPLPLTPRSDAIIKSKKDKNNNEWVKYKKEFIQ